MKLVLEYSPGTRALTGAIIESVNNDIETGLIYKTLNPVLQM